MALVGAPWGMPNAELTLPHVSQERRFLAHGFSLQIAGIRGLAQKLPSALVLTAPDD